MLGTKLLLIFRKYVPVKWLIDKYKKEENPRFVITFSRPSINFSVGESIR
jgi:hypothetical protein